MLDLLMKIMMMIWSCIVQILQWIIDFVYYQIWSKATASTTVFDTGRSVRLGKQIAEGGFSYVFEAYETKNNNNRNRKYALKRITISSSDPSILQGCLREAGVHRALGDNHPNLMPLLGMCELQQQYVYMLFPYMEGSLRTVVNKAVFNNSTEPRIPFVSELRVLQLFYQIVCGVSVMHDNNFTHRDIKLENILLDESTIPVLMDFGSVGTIEERIDTRSQLMTLLENASQHTTLPYRPPELLESNMILRAGDEPVDFTKVDVWSLGCTLYAMCYGASPFECEIPSNTTNIRIVECTPLRIINGKIPFPSKNNTKFGNWYSDELHTLITTILNSDRHRRMTLDELMVEIETRISNLGGKIPKNTNKSKRRRKDHDDDNDSDLDALLSSNRFV